MKLAHISDCFPPRLGGIEVQVAELTRRLSEAGDEVTVITATPGDEVRQGSEVVDGVTIDRVTANMPMDLPVNPRTRKNLVPLLRELQPDVAHVHLGVVSPFAWGGIRAAVEVGIPTLVTVHCVWGPAAKVGYSAANGLVKWSKSGVQISAVSSVAARPIEAVAKDDLSVLIVPNGVDPDDWNSSGRTVSGPGEDAEKPVRFVAAMRLAPRKRATPLLKMFARAQEMVGPDTKMELAIAGDGPNKKRLQSWIDKHGLTDQIKLLGRLTRPDLRQLYWDSDVFIQPSVRESFGLAALEARATGLPVVARSQTGLTEFITDGVEGLLADDDAGMAAAIAQLAENPDLRYRMLAHNTDVEPAQTWPKVLDVVREAYDITIAASTGSKNKVDPEQQQT